MVSTLLERADRVLVAATLWLRIAAGVVIVLMMATTVYDVVMRYLFAKPTDWAFTLNAAGILVATFFAVPHLAAVHGHIEMDLLHRKLRSRIRAVADVVGNLVTLTFGILLAWLGYRATYGAYLDGLYTSGNFALPMWVLYVMVYIGGLGLGLVIILSPWRKRTGPTGPDTSAGVS